MDPDISAHHRTLRSRPILSLNCICRVMTLKSTAGPLGTLWIYNIPKTKTNYGYNSIKVIGAKLFNQLPEGIKKAQTEKKLKIL